SNDTPCFRRLIRAFAGSHSTRIGTTVQCTYDVCTVQGGNGAVRRTALKLRGEGWRAEAPHCGTSSLAHKRAPPLKAGPVSFKRLLGRAPYQTWPLSDRRRRYQP